MIEFNNSNTSGSYYSRKDKDSKNNNSLNIVEKSR